MVASRETRPALDGVFRAVPSLKVSVAPGAVTVRAPGVCLGLDDPHGAVARALASLGLPQTIEEIALASGVSSDATKDLVESLYAEGLLEDESDRAHAGGLFLHHLRARGRAWERESDGARRLMSAWNDEAASRGLATGFLIEEWHHIRATPALISALLDAPGTLVAREQWAALIVSERAAENAMAGALQDLLRGSSFDAARELATGRALREGLQRCARRGVLDYLACSAPFGHSREGLEGKVAFLRGLPRHGIPAAVLAPFLERALAFLAAGLDDLVAASFLAEEEVSGRRRHELLSSLREHVARCDSFYLELLLVYGAAPLA